MCAEKAPSPAARGHHRAGEKRPPTEAQGEKQDDAGVGAGAWASNAETDEPRKSEKGGKQRKQGKKQNNDDLDTNGSNPPTAPSRKGNPRPGAGKGNQQIARPGDTGSGGAARWGQPRDCGPRGGSGWDESEKKRKRKASEKRHAWRKDGEAGRRIRLTSQRGKKKKKKGIIILNKAPAQ